MRAWEIELHLTLIEIAAAFFTWWEDPESGKKDAPVPTVRDTNTASFFRGSESRGANSTQPDTAGPPKRSGVAPGI